MFYQDLSYHGNVKTSYPILPDVVFLYDDKIKIKIKIMTESVFAKIASEVLKLHNKLVK